MNGDAGCASALTHPLPPVCETSCLGTKEKKPPQFRSCMGRRAGTRRVRSSHSGVSGVHGSGVTVPARYRVGWGRILSGRWPGTAHSAWQKCLARSPASREQGQGTAPSAPHSACPFPQQHCGVLSFAWL